MDRPEDRNDIHRPRQPVAGGVFMLLSLIIGIVIGIVTGEISLGTIIGFVVGTAIAIGIWLVDRRRA